MHTIVTSIATGSLVYYCNQPCPIVSDILRLADFIKKDNGNFSFSDSLNSRRCNEVGFSFPSASLSTRSLNDHNYHVCMHNIMHEKN